MTMPPASGPQPQPAPDQEPVRAPEFEGGEWLQGGPVVIRDSGGPVIVDFWDYTCVNCLRTLPYLAEWHRRYARHGLTIVGVHTPEFSFARNAGHLRRAIETLDIPYPVISDPGYRIWEAYTNRYWPTKYFVDARGFLRAHHSGEGAYGESEQFIQALLSEGGVTAEFPPLLAPLRPEDAPGAVCYRVTPELYCGYQRGVIGNTGTLAADSPHRYTDPGKHVEGALYLNGDWIVGGESLARPFGAQGPSRASLAYMAADVNVVLHPPVTGGPGRLRVLLDGAPVNAAQAGEDVRDGVATIDTPRMYQLVRDTEVDRHELVLETESDGMAAYAFTFTSCVAPGEGAAL